MPILASPEDRRTITDDNENFYQSLRVFSDFRLITEAARFVPVPDNWSIALADVENSTSAIAEGKYKNVNTIGALVIAALLNAAGEIEIPFVFGGDGATLLIPSSLRAKAEGALLGVQKLAKSEFGLKVRVGIAPLSEVYAAGESVRVAKFAVSDKYAQVAVNGGGLQWAEQALKKGKYLITKTESKYEPDFTGYSCRWKAIQSPRGENMSLLVQAMGQTETQKDAIYRAVLDDIERIYGDAHSRHPVTPDSLRPVGAADMTTEIAVKKAGGSPLVRLGQALLLQVEVAAVNRWIRRNKRTTATQNLRWFPLGEPNAPVMEWGKYKDYIVETTDCQKIDGVLRMVMSGDAARRERLTHSLQARYENGELFYGMHTAPESLMTCLVFQPNGRQVHFVDGTNGGYTLAAQAMKAQMP